MAFKFTSSDHFWFPIDLHSIDDNGKPATYRIKGKFKRLPTEEVEAFQASGFDPVLYASCVEKANGDKDMAVILLSAELQTRGDGIKTSEARADDLLTVLIGWDEVSDEEGKVEFSRDALVRLLRFSKSAYADIRDAYNRAVSGEGKKGN